MKEDDYGLHYQYGKLWVANDFGGRDENPWNTSSSLTWTAAAQDAASPPLPPAAIIQTPRFIPPIQGQAVHASDSRLSSHGRGYPASSIAMDVQPRYATPLAVSPHFEEVDFGTPLSCLPPSPRFMRSVQIDPSLAAHQRVPPEKLSTYSELSPNIEFMERLKLEESYNPPRRSRPAVVPAAPQPPINTTAAQVSLLDVSTPTEQATSKAPTSRAGSGKSQPSASASTTSAPQTSTAAPTKKRKRRKAAVDESGAPGSSSSAMSSEEIAKAESRKPNLACTFCRERKISCGRPPPGSPDDTCNQCARRSFKCIFLPETSSSKSRRRS